MLHPFDLATNKVLALAGRLEPRAWVDTIECHKKLQHLGFLVWAACGKDPGVNLDMLLSDAMRHHYSQEELNLLDYVDSAPSASALSILWKEAVASAKKLVDQLPEEHLGECLLSKNNELYNVDSLQIAEELNTGNILFHKGSIRGAWPKIVASSEE